MYVYTYIYTHIHTCIYRPVQPATRYCVRIGASNSAGDGPMSGTFEFLTDVHPPENVRYDGPLVLDPGAIAPLVPTVDTRDCSTLLSVTVGFLQASDCGVKTKSKQQQINPIQLNLRNTHKNKHNNKEPTIQTN